MVIEQLVIVAKTVKINTNHKISLLDLYIKLS